MTRISTPRECCQECEFNEILSCIERCNVRRAYDDDPEAWIKGKEENDRNEQEPS